MKQQAETGLYKDRPRDCSTHKPCKAPYSSIGSFKVTSSHLALSKKCRKKSQTFPLKKAEKTLFPLSHSTLTIICNKAALLLSHCCSGVDDVFVFISTFRQASHLRQPQQRMLYTIKTAGRATFLTSFTTAAAYAANTFSQVIMGE